MTSRRLPTISLETSILRRLLAIENNRNLFKSNRLGLRVGKVDHDNLEDDDGTDDDVVPAPIASIHLRAGRDGVEENILPGDIL
jgi:hypothetical protein